MISKIFSLAVAGALLYLVQQQFPHETRGMLEWMDARVEAVASRASSWGGAVPDANESGLRAEVGPSVTEPSAGDVEVIADAVAEPEVRGASPPIPIRRESPAVDPIPPATVGPPSGPQTVAAESVSPDANRRLDRDTARIRRDALSALAERMETMAIERAL